MSAAIMALPRSFFVVFLLGLFTRYANASFHNNNSALSKPAFQSSTFTADGFPATAARAVDGIVSNVTSSSCTQTESEHNPWWMVDLQNVYAIISVTIANRGDCCADRLHDFKIFVSNHTFSSTNGQNMTSPDDKNNLCNFQQAPLGLGEIRRIACESRVYGQYVYIQIQTDNPEILTLCEVRVETEQSLEILATKNSLPLIFLKILSGRYYYPTDICTPVKVQLNSLEFLQSDPESRYLTINIDLETSWYDPIFVWDLAERNGTESFMYDLTKAYGQHLIPFYTYDPFVYPVDVEFKMVIQPFSPRRMYFNGTVKKRVIYPVKTACIMDMKDFPYDSHQCSIKMMSYYFNASQVQLHLSDNEVLKTMAKVRAPLFDFDVTYAGSNISEVELFPGQTFSCAEFLFKLERKQSYYVHVFVLPAVLSMFAVPLIFIIPFYHEDKLSLGGFILLVTAILYVLLDEYLPKGHLAVPNLVRYYSAIAVLDTLCIAVSTVLSNVALARHKTTRIPDLAKWIFLDVMSRYLFVEVGLGDSGHAIVYNVDPTVETAPPVSSPRNEASTSSSQSGQTSVPGFATSDSGDEIAKCALALGRAEKSREIEALIAKEWRVLLCVIDRLLFVAVTVVVALCTLSMFSHPRSVSSDLMHPNNS